MLLQIQARTGHDTKNYFFHLGAEDTKENLPEIKSQNKTSGNKPCTILECPICNCRKRTLNHLKVHIGAVHYKDEVRKLINKDTLGCNLCNKTFKWMPHVVIEILLFINFF